MNLKIDEKQNNDKVQDLPYLIKNTKTKFEYFVNQLIPEDSIILLAGAPSSTKTFFCMELSISLALGEKVLGTYETKKSSVLYIDKDNGSIHLCKRFIKLIKGKGINSDNDEELNKLSNYYFLTQSKVKFNSDFEVHLQSLIKRYQVKLVIFDSLIRFLEGDENSSVDVSKIFEILRRVIEKQHVSIVLIHHTRKGHKNSIDDIRGTGDLIAGADVIYLINKKDNNLCVLTQEKNRFDKPMNPISYILHEEEITGNLFLKLENSNIIPTTERKMKVAVELYSKSLVYFKEIESKTFKKAEYIERFGKEYANNTIANTLDVLIIDKKIERVKHGHYNIL